MDMKVQHFDHDYKNDTTIFYVSTGLYSALLCSFVSEDPDCGVETINYQTMDKPVSSAQLAYELLCEIKDVLDYRDGKVECTTKVPVERLDDYDDCTTTTLIAFEHALTIFSDGYVPVVRNKAGNVIRIVTIEEAAGFVLENIAHNSAMIGFDVLSGDIDGHDITEYVESSNGGIYYGIRWMPLDVLDANKEDKIVIIGHYGGGCAESMYVNAKEAKCSKDELIQKMCQEFEATPGEKIVLETITLGAVEER